MLPLDRPLNPVGDAVLLGDNKLDVRTIIFSAAMGVLWDFLVLAVGEPVGLALLDAIAVTAAAECFRLMDTAMDPANGEDKEVMFPRDALNPKVPVVEDF